MCVYHSCLKGGEWKAWLAILMGEALCRGSGTQTERSLKDAF